MTDLLTFAREHGFTYTGETTSRNHLICVNEATGIRVTLSCSPSSNGSLHATKAKIRRKAREVDQLLAAAGPGTEKEGADRGTTRP